MAYEKRGVQLGFGYIEGVDYIVSDFYTMINPRNPAERQRHENYECVHCQFSSVDRQVIIEHLLGGIHPYGWGLDEAGQPILKHPSVA